TPAAVFAITHFPDDAHWQLLDAPISRGDFFRSPMMSPAFHAAALELVSPDRSQIDARGEAIVTIKNPRGKYFMATHGDERCAVQSGSHVRVTCRAASAGQYDLKLFANDQQFGTFEYVGQLQVNAN